MIKRVAINGLGRIGRCVLRSIFENGYDDVQLVAINAPSHLDNYLNVIKYDSVHGRFNAEIKAIGNEELIINGHHIKKTSEKDITKLDWKNVDYVIESSGKFNTKESAIHHLNNNVQKVVVSAPCTDADATIVIGVNENILRGTERVISIGSCTTNCLAPIANLMNSTVGIESGFVTTVHAMTSDQNLLDNSHKDPRRARACNLSMIPTSTGAARAISLVIPELAGKLDGSAIRVPTSNVSLIDFTFKSLKKCDVATINNVVKDFADNNNQNIIQYQEEKLVSVDYNHTTYSCIFDASETRVINSNFVRILCWYDNEWAYSQRILDLIRIL